MDTLNLVIDTHGLSKAYGEIRALKSLDVKVARNSIFGFLGPNGVGKTTTIGPVIGISIAVGIGMITLPQFLGTLVPWLIAILPGKLGDVALAIGAELPLPADWHFQLVSTGVLIVIFIAVAIARWGREEF